MVSKHYWGLIGENSVRKDCIYDARTSQIGWKNNVSYQGLKLLNLHYGHRHFEYLMMFYDVMMLYSNMQNQNKICNESQFLHVLTSDAASNCKCMFGSHMGPLPHL